MPVDVSSVVESALYREVVERADLPELARRLFCAALLNEAGGAPEGAAIRFLEAAWACDDAGAVEQARICRVRSAEMFRDALDTLRYAASESQVLSLFADVLRRAGSFDEAAAAASQTEEVLATAPDNEDTARAIAVVRYIRRLAKARDDRVHTVDEAVASDARRPG